MVRNPANVRIILTAFVAVCGAAKLDRTYLPPASAKTAGGSPGALQTPNSFSQNEAPKGSYTNDFQGVVVDAALAGTRASGSEVSGLGGPRNSYGSTASKVGEAAFRGSQAGFRFPVTTQEEAQSHTQFQDSRPERPQANQFGNSRDTPERAQPFGAPRDSLPERSETFGDAQDSRAERPQATQERTASTLRFDSEVGVEAFNYAFETDNGISAEESGTATNGVQARGGYSYTGDDGKVYTVTYTADEGGYQPRGDHLPTPPPIPEEILKSLEQNARDEANGVVDDGLYDAQKYNEGGDYAESDIVNAKQNGRPSVNTGNSDVDTSGTFISQNNLPFNPNNQRQRNEDRAPVNQFKASNGNGNFQSSSVTGNRFGSRNEYLPPINNQNRPQNARPQVSSANANTPDADSSSTFQQETTEGSGDFHSDSHDNQEAPIRPAAPAFSRPTNQNQFNGVKESSTSNQFNQNANRFPSSQGSRPQFGSQGGRNQFAAQPSSSSLNSQHATSIPDTELTTPFESSNQDGSQSSAPAATNAFGFDAQSRPGKPQFGFQNTQREPTRAPAQPTIPSFTQSRPQNSNNQPLNGNRYSQSVFSSQAPQVQDQINQQSQFGNKRPQFSQNQFSQNSEPSFASSTQKPQFAQQSNTQDDSYYYNQPTRTFNTPNTQGSRFPSAPSYQFDRVTQRPSFSSQTTQYSEEENYPSTPFPSQNGQRQGSTRYPRPSAMSTESTPINNQFQGNAIASATNGITQASASSFAAPTSATGFNRQQFGQTRQQFQQSPFQSNRPSSPKPNKPFVAQATVQPQSNQGQQFEQQSSETAQPLSQQPLQDVKQPKLDDDETPADTPVTNPQYDGELYEYNKPAELPPAPKDGFGQFGTKVQSSKPTQSRPQISQSNIAEVQQPTSVPSSASKPSRFGQPAESSQEEQFKPRPQFSQSSVPQPEKPTFGSFGSKPMRFGQAAKVPQGDQFGAQTTQEQSTDNQFNMKPTRQQFGQSAQGTEGNSQFQAAKTTQRRPLSPQSQGNFGSSAVENSRPFGQNGRQSCCKAGFGQSQNFGQGRPSQFGGESQFGQSSFQGSAGLRPGQSQSVAGRGEVFGGPRKPPSFDENGYHY